MESKETVTGMEINSKSNTNSNTNTNSKRHNDRAAKQQPRKNRRGEWGERKKETAAAGTPWESGSLGVRESGSPAILPSHSHVTPCLESEDSGEKLETLESQESQRDTSTLQAPDAERAITSFLDSVFSLSVCLPVSAPLIGVAPWAEGEEGRMRNRDQESQGWGGACLRPCPLRGLSWAQAASR